MLMIKLSGTVKEVYKAWHVFLSRTGNINLGQLRSN
jgi:hypothetical protein